MNDSFVLDSLLTSFELEILNQFELCKDGLLVKLADGSKAIVKTKNVA